MSLFVERPEKSSIELLLMKFHSTMKRAELEKEFNSTSPYAITTRTPSSRLVDNAIIKGSWHSSPVRSAAHRGFFGGLKAITVSGGEGSGRIDTEVQFDEIFKCPVTGREFMQKDIDAYKDSLRREVDQYVSDMLLTAIYEENPMKTGIRLATDGRVFEIEPDSIEKLLSFELEGVDFVRELVKYKVEVEK